MYYIGGLASKITVLRRTACTSNRDTPHRRLLLAARGLGIRLPAKLLCVVGCTLLLVDVPRLLDKRMCTAAMAQQQVAGS